jgi:hypothetical protein
MSEGSSPVPHPAQAHGERMPIRGCDLSRVAALALTLVFAAVTARSAMTASFVGEPDLERMVFAVVLGSVSGLRYDADVHYGLSFSFGFYEALYGLLPIAVLTDPRALAAVFVGVGWISAVVSVWLCFAWLREAVGDRAALAATGLFALSPMATFTATNGHPLMLGVALALAGACCLARWDRPGPLQQAWGAGAVLLLLASLTVRAETVLLFPAMVLPVIGGQLPVPREALRRLARRTVPAALAFVAFLVLKGQVESQTVQEPWRLSGFLSAFYRPGMMARGVGVLLLAGGVALIGVGAWAAWRALRRPAGVAALGTPLLALAIALPSIAFWLPNPQPSRHFWFAVLGIALIAGHALARHLSDRKALVAAALATVTANQVVAEIAYPIIATRYEWSYPALDGRRATSQLPLGALWPNASARDAMQSRLLEEARSLARAVRDVPRLLVFADLEGAIGAELVRTYPQLRVERSRPHGAPMLRLKSSDREYLIIQKYPLHPQDVQALFLDDPAFSNWPVYVQPTTASRFDRAEVPAYRLLAIH